MTPWNVAAKEGVFGENHYNFVRARVINEQREVNRFHGDMQLILELC